MLKIAVFASGSGTNFEAIAKSTMEGGILSGIACIEALFCNVEGALCMERARKLGITVELVPHAGYPSRKSHEEEMGARLGTCGIELIVLAGYMRMLSPSFIRSAYRHEKKLPGIMNIHPALLPAFPGTRGYEDAFEYGVKVSGITVHYVDEGMDTGPIILQEAVPLHEGETIEMFKKRGIEVEHRLYPEAIRLDALGMLAVEGRKVVIRNSG